MKKIFALLLTTSLLLSVTACTATAESTTADASDEETESVQDTTEESTENIDATEPAPELEDIEENITDVLSSFYPGVAGYTIHVAEAGYSMFTYASNTDLSKVSQDELSNNIAEALDEYTDDEKQMIVYNMEAINTAIEGCISGAQSSLHMFDDIDAYDQMQTLSSKSDAARSWRALNEAFGRATSGIKIDPETFGG